MIKLKKDTVEDTFILLTTYSSNETVICNFKDVRAAFESKDSANKKYTDIKFISNPNGYLRVKETPLEIYGKIKGKLYKK